MELPNLITTVQRNSDTETTYGEVSKHQQKLLHSVITFIGVEIKLIPNFSTMYSINVLHTSTGIVNMCTTFHKNIPVFKLSHPKATMEALV